MNSLEFWNDTFARGHDYSRVEILNKASHQLNSALKYFENVKDKVVIDLGCGYGLSSLFFASQGANVISIDYSKKAIDHLSEFCKNNSIKNINPIALRAQKIRTFGKVDFIYGSDILHHIEPFDEFAKALKDTIKPNGKLFFLENSARSKIMIWFRENIVGRFGVPKYGDEEEFPLMPSEISELSKYFNVRIEYPELLYFRLISRYLLHGHCTKPFKWADKYCYKFEGLRKYSYRQYLFLN